MLAGVADQFGRESFVARARAQFDELRTGNPEEWNRDRAESRTWQQRADRDALALHDGPGRRE